MKKLEKVLFDPEDGKGISCKFGNFEPGTEYKVSKEVKEALLKIPGFSDVKQKAKRKESDSQ